MKNKEVSGIFPEKSKKDLRIKKKTSKMFSNYLFVLLTCERADKAQRFFLHFEKVQICSLSYADGGQERDSTLLSITEPKGQGRWRVNFPFGIPFVFKASATM